MIQSRIPCTRHDKEKDRVTPVDRDLLHMSHAITGHVTEIGRSAETRNTIRQLPSAPLTCASLLLLLLLERNLEAS